jgi:flagellar basal body rod protein FlgB
VNKKYQFFLSLTVVYLMSCASNKNNPMVLWQYEKNTPEVNKQKLKAEVSNTQNPDTDAFKHYTMQPNSIEKKNFNWQEVSVQETSAVFLTKVEKEWKNEIAAIKSSQNDISIDFNYAKFVDISSAYVLALTINNNHLKALQLIDFLLKRILYAEKREFFVIAQGFIHLSLSQNKLALSSFIKASELVQSKRSSYEKIVYLGLILSSGLNQEKSYFYIYREIFIEKFPQSKISKALLNIKFDSVVPFDSSSLLPLKNLASDSFEKLEEKLIASVYLGSI